jgi:hypothetical protein
VFSDPTYLESKLLPFDTPPDAQWIEQYDYESDSDLGYLSDSEDSETSAISSEVADSKFINDFTDEMKDHNTLDNTQIGQQVADVKPDPDPGLTGALCQNGKTSPRCCGERVGKVVCVKDIAYVTSVSPSCFLKLSHADRTVSSKLESNDFLPLHESYFVRTTLFEFTVTRSIDE